ncbi:hypothetical protein B0186_04145 [Canicola haemoglobinophilus]|uniref:DUF7675 domain-containing protein n=1 Tax=Canicola haemoglobinophilus TaxID=733 RepID=A0A1V4B226_9PAST|nr:hypothetical protein [Canicola haemoglobinophilus]OOS01274.1 hypothetical protein B0186_04145 [Canicola haemoglobinophilus]STO60120.1 Uncharacterised protein [Canicola haemoglobinophilus]
MIFWEKHEETDKVWWKRDTDVIGEMIFSFDKKEEFNLWTDYPHKLTAEQKMIFDKENSYFAQGLENR